MNNKNRQIALDFFHLQEDFDEEDFFESLDVLLFELKTFFNSKIFIEKILASKLKKLNQIIEKAEVIGFSFPEVEEVKMDLKEGSILEIYTNYQKIKLNLKLKLNNSSNPREIISILNQLVLLEKKYASFWFKENYFDVKTIVSIEPNPMDIITACKEFEAQGFINFEDLSNSENNPPEILKNEMKRLSLLFQNY